MSFKEYSVSVRGASHREAGEACQDSARTHCSEKLAVAAVSDGHGSEKHFRSAAGSEMATRVAIRSICDFFDRNADFDELFSSGEIAAEKAARRIAANIILGWNSEIAAHIAFSPLSDREQAVCDRHGGIANEVMYGATLIVAALTEKGCFGLQIGDGSFLARRKDEACFCPMPEDAKLLGNLTTSLCDSDAIGSFRWFYLAGVSGLVLSSDGLINSFKSAEDFVSFGGRVLSAVENDAAAFLPEHLKSRSENGSRDDISVAAVAIIK
ncbi:MAG: protein phosphatase 2C domain-containing protein [Oscillospiraceae bacterium]|nr:protein phosphatase 2C domain-containing protein [Oscillospiraceae bacterium]